MTSAILPNGNDILLDLIGRDMIRRKVTVLGEFIPSAEWFAKPEQARRDLLRYCAALTSQRPKGVYLDVQTRWAWFRGDPKSGVLEVSYDGRETWEPYPWPEREEDMTKAYDLYRRYSVQELIEMDRELAHDPDNKNPPGSFHIYKDHIAKKMREITWAIRMLTDEEAMREEVQNDR